MPFLFSKVMVVGLGQIGGSLALAIRRNKIARQILGADQDSQVLKRAHASGVIDQAISGHFSKITNSLQGVELLLLSVPVTAIREFLEMASKSKNLKPGLIMMDVGSTKASILKAAGKLPPGIFFVGAHPIAGTEKIGLEGRNEALFLEKRCLLTPLSKTPPSIIRKVTQFWKRVGCRAPRPLSASTHDRILAATSHLPHMAAYSLLTAVAELVGAQKEIKLCLGGLKDTTRVASSSPRMWRDIVLENKGELTRAMQQFQKKVQELTRLIQKGDAPKIERFFTTAKNIRDQF